MHRQGLRRSAQACITAAARRSTLQTRSYANSASTPNASANVLYDVYKQRVEAGQITYDPVQVRSVHHLDTLYDKILHYGGPKPYEEPVVHFRPEAKRKTGSFQPWWKQLLPEMPGKPSRKNVAAKTEIDPSVPKGLYLYGGVGCGKTYVMDMFFDNLPVEKKMRVHFHKFMLDIHKKMHQLRKSGHHEDPIPLIADDLLENSWLLCFDEFQVTDVADALILRRLFSALLERGFVMVATSNRPPSELYKNGIQRDLFLPFIDLLNERCDVVSLLDSETDYRVLKGAVHADNVYLSPLDAHANAVFNYEFKKHCRGERVEETSLVTQGRQVHVPMAARGASVCQFSFQELCEKPLGAADYIVIAEAFSVVFVRDIPKLRLEQINSMRRFITFVDCMYDKGVRLHCLADAPAETLYQVDMDAKGHFDEAFAFDRTVSRLMEMGSEAYLQAHADASETPHLYLEATEAPTTMANKNHQQHQQHENAA